MDSRTAALYLDQNHLSHLARHPDAVAYKRVADLLLDHRVGLAISPFHVVETAHPAFTSGDDVCGFVDSCEIVWCRYPGDIHAEELGAALDKAIFGIDRPISLFGKGFLDVYGVDTTRYPTELVALLDTFQMAVDWARHHPEGRDERTAAMNLAVIGEQAKRDTDLDYARDHSHSIVFNLDYHWSNEYRPPPGMQLPTLERSDLYEIYRKIGGIGAFPMLGTLRKLEEKRMTDKSFKAVGNHILDEWHAQYGPYVDAIALDRNTWTRVKDMKLPFAEHATADLAEVPRILKL